MSKFDRSFSMLGRRVRSLRRASNAAGIACGRNRRVEGFLGKALTRCTGHHWQWS